jgi:hypothetical protein
MRLKNNIYTLILDLIQLKKKYRELYFEQLRINNELKEKIKELEYNLI